MNFQNSIKLLTALILAVWMCNAARADVCVWRDPEKTMVRLFPKAKDYETIDVKISKEALKRIETRLSKKLDPGERENWIYYKIRGSGGKTLGYILTDAEKGEYGAIEIVAGVDVNGKVIGIYIQRAREKNKEFKSKEFLGQFTGKTKDDSLLIGKDIAAKSALPTEQVAFGVRKMLAMYDNLKGL